MKTNSLAFRLFVTAAAWVLLVLPIAGGIIYLALPPRGRRPASTAASRFCSPSSSATPSSTPSDEPGAPKNCGEPLFEITHSGWYWQIKPLDGRPGPTAASRARSPSDVAAISAAERARSSPTRARCAGRNLDGPVRAARCASPRQIYVFGDGKTGPALFGRRRRHAGRGRGQPRRLPQPPHPGAGAGRHRPARRHAVPDPVRPVSAARDGAGPGRHPLGRGRAARGRPARGDRAAAAGAQRAAQVQPGDRRARAHPRRQPRARPQDAARRHHQRGARATPRRSARKVTEQADDHDHPGQSLSRPRPHGRAHRRHRPRDARCAPWANPSCARWSASIATSSSPISLDCPPAPASRASGRTWRRCWATCSTTPPSGRAREVMLAASPAAAAARQRRAANWLEIRVDDDGPGLTAEQIAEPIAARPAAGRDQARLRPRPLHRRGSGLLLQRQVRAGARPSRRPVSARLTLPAALTCSASRLAQSRRHSTSQQAALLPESMAASGCYACEPFEHSRWLAAWRGACAVHAPYGESFA